MKFTTPYKAGQETSRRRLSRSLCYGGGGAVAGGGQSAPGALTAMACMSAYLHDVPLLRRHSCGTQSMSAMAGASEGHTEGSSSKSPHARKRSGCCWNVLSITELLHIKNSVLHAAVRTSTSTIQLSSTL